MKIYLRVFRYVLHYWKQLAASVVCMVLFVVFSAFSVGLVLPFINVLLQGQKAAPTEQRQDNSAPVEKPSSEKRLAALEAKVPNLRQLIEKKVDDIFAKHSRIEALQLLCLVLLVGFLLKNVFRIGQAYFMSPLEQGVIRDLRNELFQHFHRLSLSYFHSERIGQLISRVTYDVTVINASVTAAINSLFRDPLLLVIYLIFLLVLSWKLTLMVFVLFSLTGLVATKIGNKLKRDSLRMQERIADLTSVLQESLYGIRVVKAFSSEKFEIDKFEKENKSFYATVVRMTRLRKLGPSIIEYLGVIVSVLVLYFGGREVLKSGDALSPGAFVLFLGALFSMMQPLKYLGQVHNSLKEGMVAAQRVFGVLDTPPKIKDRRDAVEFTEFKDSIRFQDVSFQYEQGGEVLRNVSLEVKKGEMLAIVGPSGGGKSTLVDLLVRFYDPTAGRIEIDGLDLRQAKLASLRQLMGVVTQETILFNDTVRNNIAYGMDHVAAPRIVEAAKAANAHEFISELPQGYDTLIGDRGVKLSGGQRQRLAIARAILKNPPILIFDEATSALDTESELLVQQAIERLLQGRTSFVIAHRLSTVRHANKIIVLDQGQIVQQGKHADLVQQEGLYKKLYEMQFQEQRVDEG